MKVPSVMVSPSPGWVPGAGQSWGAGLRWALQRGPHTHVASISSPPPRLGLCPPVKHDWAFQDRDTQFYRFPGSEPEPAGIHELEEELAEALALLSQRGPDALLTVALRKP